MSEISAWILIESISIVGLIMFVVWHTKDERHE
jgi:hypothetical protein